MCEDCNFKRWHDKQVYHEDRGTRRLVKKGEKSASRKVLLDRLTAARISLVNAVERRAERGRDSWWAWGYEWAEKRYQKALQDCWDFGIDIKS